MTNTLAWLAAYWQMLAIGLAFLIFLTIGTAWAFCWYFWRLVIEAEAEREPLPSYVFGDNPRIPDDYWNAVDRHERKGRAA